MGTFNRVVGSLTIKDSKHLYGYNKRLELFREKNKHLYGKNLPNKNDNKRHNKNKAGKSVVVDSKTYDEFN